MLHDEIFLETCLATVEKEIHCKLQKTRYTLQSRAATCNRFKTIHVIIAESRTELYFVIFASPKNLREKLQKGHVTRCNPPATCLITLLQHKLQRKLHHVTLAAESVLLLATIVEIFETIVSYSLKQQWVTCLLQLVVDFFFSVARQVARKIASCNTSFICITPGP